MGKKVNSVFAVLVFAGFALFLAVEGADAFCVYNDTTDRIIQVEQVSGGKEGKQFKAKLTGTGEKSCCNWQNKDCNKEGKRDSTVTFNVYLGDYWQKNFICTNFPIKAGGWLTVEGSGGKYKCVRHDY